MKRSVWVLMVVFLVGFALVMPGYAAEEKKKDEVKITGSIVSIPADPKGKLAPIAIKTDKDEIGVINNDIAKKMAKYIGAKADLTGKMIDVEGKKAIEVWLFQRKDESGKKPKLKQPVES